MMQPNKLLNKKKANQAFAHAKRLLGSPQRFFASLAFILLPFLMLLAGLLDYGNSEIYKATHTNNKAGDQRKNYFVAECFKIKKLCDSGVNPLDSSLRPTQEKRIEFYPLHGIQPLHELEPFYYFFFFLTALMAFARIGNPRFDPKNKALAKLTKDSELPPAPQPGQDDLNNFWTFGGVIPRTWEADPGKYLLDRAAKIPYYLSTQILQTGLLIVAPPGSGKTGSVFRPLIKYMRQTGSAAIFWDSKGQDFDQTLFDYNFDLDSPISIKIMLYSGETPAQAGERLGEALIPNLSEEKRYFSDVAKDAMSALVASHFELYDSYPDLTTLLLYLAQPEALEDLAKQLVNPARNNVKETAEQISQLGSGLSRVKQLAEGKNDALGSLITALTPLTTSKISRVLVANPESNTHTIEDLMRKPCLLRLSLPIANSPRIAPIIGRLILAQFNFAVLSPECNREIFKLAAVDEARHFISANVANGMAQSRSNNAGFALALQTLNQIENKSLLETIFANAGNKIIMRGVSDEDGDKFSRSFGEVELPYVSYSENIGISLSTGTSSSRSGGSELSMSAGKNTTQAKVSTSTGTSSGKNKSTGQSANLQYRLRRQFLPAEIINLPTRYAVVTTSDAEGQRWTAQVVNLDKNLVEALEQDFKAQEAKALKAKKHPKALPIPAPGQLPNAKKSPAKPKLLDAPVLLQDKKPAQAAPAQQSTLAATVAPVAKPQTQLFEQATPALTPTGSENAPEQEGEETASDIKTALMDAGIKANQVEELLRLVASYERQPTDILKLVADVQADMSIKHKATAIVRHIRNNDYDYSTVATSATAAAPGAE